MKDRHPAGVAGLCGGGRPTHLVSEVRVRWSVRVKRHTGGRESLSETSLFSTNYQLAHMFITMRADCHFKRKNVHAAQLVALRLERGRAAHVVGVASPSWSQQVAKPKHVFQKYPKA